MEIVFVPYAARGHVAPMLAAASALVTRGVRVRMVVPAPFAAHVRAAGAVPVVPDVVHDVRVPAGKGPGAVGERARLRRGRRALATATAETSRRLVAERRPSLVVIDPHTAWLRGLPLPGGTPAAWLWTTAGRTARGHLPVLVNGLPQLRARRGRRDRRVRFVGPLVGAMTTPDPGLPWDRIRAGRVVVASPGTVFTPGAAELKRLIGAFAGTEWTLVLATGRVPVADLGPLPGNVVAHPWIPQLEVLRHAEVLVTHGGMNSVLEAITCGVPMLVRPRIGEQRRTASRIVELGVGRRLRRWTDLRATAERLADEHTVRARLSGLRERARAVLAAGAAAEELVRLAEANTKC
ncbi:glycosyltransferase [Amycolatopsis samaneae]|uniref:Glycosyltransferase n=1 Tax=Amycolatopsis samaneae TaxID=664691 RepID=A0ABW5GS14_9PSEU